MPHTVPEIAARVREGMSTLDTTPFADLFATDAVYELPFLGQRTEGREAIVAQLAAAGVRAREIGVTDVRVEVTLTETGFVLELTVAGRGFAFPSSVGVVTVAEGLITSYRDYPNVPGASAAAGASDATVLGRAVKPRMPETAE